MTLPPLALCLLALDVGFVWVLLALPRARTDPRVPMGALGYRVAEPERAPARPTPPPAPDRRASTWVWVARGEAANAPRLARPRTEPVLGGAAAVRQAAQIVRRSTVTAKIGLATVRDAESRREFFERFERAADEQLKDALALNVLPFDGETDVAYDERLTRIYRNFRARTDGWTRMDVVAEPPARDARPTNVRQTGPTPSVAEVVERARSRPAPIVLTHGERRALRKRFWRKFRRWPTDDEFADLAEREKGVAAG